MTIVRRTELDNVGFDVGNDPSTQGQMALRWAKLTFDGDTLLTREPHRVVLNAGDDIDANMATVNASLTALGFAPMPDDDIDWVKQIAAKLWTPMLVAAYQDKVAAMAAKADAERASQIEAEAEIVAARTRQINEAVAAALAAANGDNAVTNIAPSATIASTIGAKVDG